MKGLRDYLLAAAGIAIMGLVLALVNPGSARACTPASPKMLTHLGVPPTDIVMLRREGSEAFGPLFRVHPDGTEDADPFVVPEGKFFVATDFEFRVRDLFPVESSEFSVGFERTIPPLTQRILHTNAVKGNGGQIRDGVVTESAGRTTGSVSATTGFVAGPLTRVVAGIRGPAIPETQVVRGYLVDAPPISVNADFGPPPKPKGPPLDPIEQK